MPTQDQVRSELGLQQGKFEEKYLGLPTPAGHMHQGKFQNLQARLMKHICVWGDGHLAQSGKKVLIKAIMQAIPTYVMGVFKLPCSVCEDLARMVRSYWWGSGKGRWKAHWKAWDRIIQTKVRGGLVLWDYHLFNQALLA